jgi:hypothetical protein
MQCEIWPAKSCAQALTEAACKLVAATAGGIKPRRKVSWASGACESLLAEESSIFVPGALGMTWDVEYTRCAEPVLYIAKLKSGHNHGPIGSEQSTGATPLKHADPVHLKTIDKMLQAKTAIVYVREWARERGIRDSYMAFYNRLHKSVGEATEAAQVQSFWLLRSGCFTPCAPESRDLILEFGWIAHSCKIRESPSVASVQSLISTVFKISACYALCIKHVMQCAFVLVAKAVADCQPCLAVL